MTETSTGNAGSDCAENLRLGSDTIEHSLQSEFTAADAPSQGQVAPGSYMDPSAITAAAAPPTAQTLLVSQSTNVSTCQPLGLEPSTTPPVPSKLAPAADTQSPGSGLPMAALLHVNAASGPQLGASPSAAAATHFHSASFGAAAKQLTQSHAVGQDTSTARSKEAIIEFDDDDEEDGFTVSQNQRLAAAKRADNQVAAQNALQAKLVANTASTQGILRRKGFGTEFAALIGLVLSPKHDCMTLCQR